MSSPASTNISLPGTSSPPSSIAFIALHAGAGVFSATHAELLKQLFDFVCRMVFSRSLTVEEAVTNAISELEASALTNAGRGSCLTEDGLVECDASLMLGNGPFGSVGAVSGVNSAIQVAFQLAKERNEKGLIEDLGRIRPIMLVGDGAYRFAVKRGLPVAARHRIRNHHITVGNQAKWVRYRAMIDASAAAGRSDDTAEGPPMTTFQQLADGSGGETSDDMDGESDTSSPDPNPFSFSMLQHGTVGAIACDYTGQVCAGVSSGGIWMKQGGRVGSSALIGCGCYAENGLSAARDGTADTEDVISVACSISGCGEDITEELMAFRCCDELRKTLSPSAGREPPHLHSIMRQLVVKNEQLSLASVQSKKRSRNATGSTDTQCNDDGHVTGIISLRVATPAATARKVDNGAGEPLKLEFCFAHTAPHFALAHATRATRHSEVVCKACVSMQSEAEAEQHNIKSGKMSSVI